MLLFVLVKPPRRAARIREHLFGKRKGK